MAIPTPPIPPSRSDPANFAARGDDTLAYLPTFVAAANALLVDITYKHDQIMALATGVAGSLNGVPIGLVTPAVGCFTNLRASSEIIVEQRAPVLRLHDTHASGYNWALVGNNQGWGDLVFRRSTAPLGDPITAGVPVISLSETGISVTGALTTSGIKEDAGGNVGLGVTPGAWNGVKAVQLGGSGAVMGDVNTVSLGIGFTGNPYSGYGSAYENTGNFPVVYRLSQNNGTHSWWSAPQGVAGQPVTFTQRMSLDAAGNLLLGTEGQINYGRLSVQATDITNGIEVKSGNDANEIFAGITTTNALAFRVAGNGNVTNTNNSYGGISDIKLKERVSDTSPKLPKMLLIRIVDYYLKSAPGQKLCGVIAQELEKIWPGLVEESPDFEDVEITPGRTEIKITKKQLVEYRDDVRYEIVDVDGKWTKLPTRTPVAVPLFTEHPLFDETGAAVIECIKPASDAILDAHGNIVTPAKPAEYQQVVHRVPVTEDVREEVEIPAITERRLTGTVTKSVKYSVFVPLLIKAMQEQHEIIDDIQERIAKLEAA